MWVYCGNSYGKGACVARMVGYYLGDEIFWKGKEELGENWVKIRRNTDVYKDFSVFECSDRGFVELF